MKKKINLFEFNTSSYHLEIVFVKVLSETNDTSHHDGPDSTKLKRNTYLKNYNISENGVIF